MAKMRVERQVSYRLREMLTEDKVGIKDGFRSLLTRDIVRVLKDYFDLKGLISISIKQDENGDYVIEIKQKASGIKQFETTLDLKR